MNSISLIGRLGKDPDTKYFEDGKVVSKTSIAVRRWGEGSDWFDLEVWGKQAQTLTDYARKGDQIGVTGRMTTETWADRNTGEERKRWVVKVSSIELCAKSRGGSEGEPSQAAAAPQRVQAPAWNANPSQMDDEDIPF
jgi:single-strand DNA-binding protein